MLFLLFFSSVFCSENGGACSVTVESSSNKSSPSSQGLTPQISPPSTPPRLCGLDIFLTQIGELTPDELSGIRTEAARVYELMDVAVDNQLKIWSQEREIILRPAP